MITSRHVLIGAMFTGIIANSGNAGTNPRCVYPDPYALAESQVVRLDRAEYLLFDTKAGPMRWLFLSWTSPSDGMAFVLACDGHVVAKRRLGYVSELKWGMPGDLGPGTGVTATTASTTGAGVFTGTEWWLQFDGKAIAVLWRHDRFVSQQGEATGKVYQWTLYPQQNEIRVTGRRTKILGDDPRPVALPTEKYCFQADANRYVRC